MYSCDEPFMRSLECYFGVYFPSCCATREINTKITLSWAHKQFATRVHTLFSIDTCTDARCLFHGDNLNQNPNKGMDELLRSLKTAGFNYSCLHCNTHPRKSMASRAHETLYVIIWLPGHSMRSIHSAIIMCESLKLNGYKMREWVWRNTGEIYFVV